MHINKGYILPVILIFLLLLLAGFFIVTQQIVEGPAIEIEKPIIPEDIKISTSTLESLSGTSTQESNTEEATPSSTTTTASSSDSLIENE